jgi:hypothetical protein
MGSGSLNYDDGAFTYFLITMLLVYLVPALVFIARRLITFRAALRKTAYAPRTLIEARKLERIARESVAVDDNAPALWTRSFTIFTSVTGVLLLWTAYLIYTAGSGTLAIYNPYGVSRAARSEGGLWARKAVSEAERGAPGGEASPCRRWAARLLADGQHVRVPRPGRTARGRCGHASHRDPHPRGPG